ncbi:XRE family transcriptional regulator [Actinoplanes sp. NPDC026623]|uniref:XRE family transcriptional regulator n=1 Tax=Actinoplanes sp. NPDC026623 TaxID=3155610 RepID=UPI0033CACA19
MAPAGAPLPPRTLADKLRHLVETVHPPSRGPFSFREIAEEIRKRQRPGERTISHTQIADLCSGRSANPQQATLTLLAGFFKVPVAYFFDETVEQHLNEQLDVVAALRDTRAQQLALRLNGLSPKSIDLVADMIKRVRELEGLDDDPS